PGIFVRRRSLHRRRRRQPMGNTTSDLISHDHHRDGIDRRGFLKCMAWAGAGTLYVLQGGVLRSKELAALSAFGTTVGGTDLLVVQTSDSHMGFDQAANADVAGTLSAAIDKINALPLSPAFVLHTGDISHLSKPSEFDTVDQMLKRVRTGAIH